MTRGVLGMNEEEYKGRLAPKKRWMIRMKDEMGKKGVSMEMTADRRE